MNDPILKLPISTQVCGPEGCKVVCEESRLIDGLLRCVDQKDVEQDFDYLYNMRQVLMEMIYVIDDQMYEGDVGPHKRRIEYLKQELEAVIFGG